MTEGVLLGYLTLAAVLVGLAVAIAWILLPFMLMGTKSLLREQLREQRRTNELLQAMRDDQDKARRAAGPAA